MVNCPSCNSENSATSKFCSECGAALRLELAATVAHAAPASSSSDTATSSDSSHHGRFLPGTKLANRYRIVSLVGKGGMGEVYRADDLRLGHTVALKFLPREVAQDQDRLARFQAEVRLTRQISHPNICRVYDMDEVDGQRFLSMEYIDGEDLRVLLRRIGRLPKDKGVQIAQQLCAGLAAAHEKGVLHRDLKPANIMIDGRGQARITDFGLARLVDEGQDVEIAGTPAYMAPEQLRLGQTTIQSDLYSLGLILYELFTGESVYKTGSTAELLQRHQDSSPSAPSSLVHDMDPMVERVILRCLTSEPHDRPASARDVAAGLPGGDALAAALAAGETPSPEMVAAAGSVGELDFRIAGALLVAVLIGLGVVCWLSNKANIVNRVGMDKHPRELISDARRILEAFGYEESPIDTAWFFEVDYQALEYVREATDTLDRPSDLSRRQPPVVYFWYRHSPVYLEPEKFYVGSLRRISGPLMDDPPSRIPGMILVRLDAAGRLIEFQAVPERADPAELGPSDLKWWETLENRSDKILGFSLADFTSTNSDWIPPVSFDARRTWHGTYPNGLPIRIETASYGGKPVYVHVIGKWTSKDREPSHRQFRVLGEGTIVRGIWVGMGLAARFVSVCLAFYHFRTGRGDRRGAFRLALFSLICSFLFWMLFCNHLPDLVAEAKQFYSAMAWIILGSVECWLLYFALEPFVRRVWPQAMISWCRVLAGRLRDPLVGQHIVVGVVFGVGLRILLQLRVLIEGFREEWGSGTAAFLPAILGTRQSVYGMLLQPPNMIDRAFIILFVLLICGMILRRRSLSLGVFVGFLILYLGNFDGIPSFRLTLVVLAHSGLVAVLLVRFGLLPLVISLTVLEYLCWPMTTDTSAWYFGTGFGALLFVFAVAAYGFFVSKGTKNVFAIP